MVNQLVEYINNPYDSDKAFELAEYYYAQNQTASALTYYLRVTEINDNKFLTYESLIKAGLCLKQQGNRLHSVKSFLLHAIGLMPSRPEAFYAISLVYQETKEWQECYSNAKIGHDNSTDMSILRTYSSQPYYFKIQMATSLYHMGQQKRSLELLLELNRSANMSAEHKKVVLDSIRVIWGTDEWAIPSYYKKGRDKIKHPFNGLDKIEQNHSQAFQDLFVLSSLNGKRNGKYLEIGSHEPQEHNNTYLLEKHFDWVGVSLDIDGNMVRKFNGIRDNKALILDATKADYLSILDGKDLGTDWDYLQLDCEPSINTFLAMSLIPFDKYRFAVITYEHDYYCDETKSYRERSRRYLKSMGYELVVSNVSVDHKSPFEDWWVHPSLVDMDKIQNMRSLNDITQASKYFLI